MNRQDVHCRASWMKTLLSTKHFAARLKFAEEHRDTSLRYWENVFRADKAKTELFRMIGQSKHENIIPVVKYGFGAALLPQGLDSLPSLRKNVFYRCILQESVRVSVCCWTWIMQQDNDCKHRGEPTTSKELFIPDIPRVCLSPSSSVEKNTSRFRAGLIRSHRMRSFELTAAKKNFSALLNPRVRLLFPPARWMFKGCVWLRH